MVERLSPAELLSAVVPHIVKVAPTRVAFIGGATTHLHVTDPLALSPRATEDVDVIVDVSTRAEYLTVFRDKLLALGAREDTSEGAPLCRWIINGVTVDIMPFEREVLGFSNRWYEQALQSAVLHRLADGTQVPLISTAYFVATKIEAFNDRGNNDFLSSKDIEDIVSIVYGRAELIDDIDSAPRAVRKFVRETLRAWLQLELFDDAIRANLPGDSAQNERLALVKDRVAVIASHTEGD